MFTVHFAIFFEVFKFLTHFLLSYVFRLIDL